MKKNLLIILSAFLASAVFAKPLPFISKQLHEIKASHQRVPQSKGAFQYTNFTGHWVSQCQDMDDMTIENDEESISIDGEEMAIGAINQLGINSREIALSDSLLPEWIEQGHALNLTINAYSVELVDNEDSLPSDFFTIISNGKMRLRNSILYINMKTAVLLNGNKMAEENINCSFIKAS